MGELLIPVGPVASRLWTARGKMPNTIAYQKSILKVNKPVEILMKSRTKNYSFLPKIVIHSGDPVPLLY
jgi:hypothetical protein